MEFSRFETDPARISYEDMDGEIIAIDFLNGAYYSLTGTAAEIWRHAEAGSGRMAIAGGAARASDDPEGARAQVDAFLDELLALGMLRETGSAVERPADFDRFERPVIEQFDDMAALIKLDPIHDVTEDGWPRMPDKR